MKSRGKKAKDFVVVNDKIFAKHNGVRGKTPIGWKSKNGWTGITDASDGSMVVGNSPEQIREQQRAVSRNEF